MRFLTGLNYQVYETEQSKRSIKADEEMTVSFFSGLYNPLA